MLNHFTYTPRRVGLTAIIVVTFVASFVNAQDAASRRAPGVDPAGVDPAVLKKTDPTGEASEDEVSQFLTYYYLRPQPERFVAVYREIAEGLEFETDANTASLAAFFGMVIRANPGKTAEWVDQLRTLPPSYHSMLYYSLGYANTDESKRSLRLLADMTEGEEQRFVFRVLSQEPPNLFTREVRTGAHLDALWGAFMATGDERYLNPIIETLGRSNPATSSKAEDIALGGAALWSLRSNAWQHSRVLETCRAAIDTASPALAEELTKIVNEIEELQKTKPCPEPKPEAKTK